MKTTVEKQESNDRTQQVEYLVPEVNIFETGEGYVVEAEMPGVPKDGLEITLADGEITIIGRRLSEPAGGEILFRERPAADFRRVFELDPAIDTTRISARMEQGVLTLELPKSERVKPRKIAVN